VPLRRAELPAHDAGAQAKVKLPAPEAPVVPSTDWGAGHLAQQLEALLPGIGVDVLAEVGSTSSTLLELARDGRPRLLVAEKQTQGRGRQGRAWHATPGASLTFSLSLPLAPASWNGLSLAVGLALAEALDPADGAGGRPRIGLKWPNDLWLWEGPGRGRKLGGILIETVAAAGARMCVVGVGLNVAPQPAEGHAAGSACLQELHAGASPPQTLARVALPLAAALRQFEAQGFAPLLAAYALRDLLRGMPVRTLPGLAEPQRAALEGVAEGVNVDGALLLRGSALHPVVSGEVSVRLQESRPC
jgi:BirA family biotin operon repressor/biotin-[acetyl-CoA-carboxylase] ligase